ncbi:MAG TPA: aspartate kinase [Candidatus Methylacidiphilales bacterium]|nr:aspartate kinase [Candidatus Methylacidiphilales bacterium]
MAFIVQKYGGTSVGSPERILNVARRVAAARKEGHKLVVVVSAMSGVTDGLIKLAREVNPDATAREMDVLLATGEQQTIALTALALHGVGVPAVSLTGAQAGIVTDKLHTKAKITNITPKKVHEHLDAGQVVIVAGFQGQNEDGHITTLGRGGSDLTAIAMAAALKADLCEIYTDVDGVYTADPRLVPHAKKIQEISYDEMLELASLGAKVMQARSVEFAKKFKVKFVVRSSFNHNPGTIITEEHPAMEEVVIRGVSLEKNQAKVTIIGVPDKPGVAAGLFSALSEAGTNVDMIVQNVSLEGTTDMTFTIAKDDLPAAKKLIEAQVAKIGAKNFTARDGISKLSVVGIGMRSHTGVAAMLFSALAGAGINIQMITTSEIKISVIINEDEGPRATQVVHDAFKLGA